MLNLLIDTMEEVIQLEKELYMPTYYMDKPPETYETIHDCGTAACILGYAALKVESTVPKNILAHNLWEELQLELGLYLAASIADGWHISRLSAAMKLKHYPLLEGHKHFTEKTTPEDALNYLLLVKRILVNENS